MNEGIRRLFPLAVVFVAAFAVVYAIRNGPDGLKKLFSGGETPSHRPETFTLPEKPPLELDDVELLARLNDEYARLTDAVVPSVVSIDTSGVRAQRMLDGYGRQLIRPVPTQGQGSGVIVTHEGHVVTNYHVVKGQQQIQVTMHNGQIHPASLIGSDPLLDIAVLKVEADVEFQPLKFGDSELVKRGQIVFAIGNPFGLGETVTQGIISALERSLSDTQRDLFQTDAAINPGNSGGPLVNLQGEIIGINSAIYRPDDRVNSGFQGVGFSIRGNDVKEALHAILERGRPIRGYLGVRMLDLDPRFRQLIGYDGPGAVIVAVGEGSPAEKAGLKPRDILTRYGGETIDSMAEIFTLVQRSRVGDKIPIDVWRDGETLTLEAVIEEARMETPTARKSVKDRGVTAPPEEVLRKVGILTRDPAPGQLGVTVTEILPDSIAAGRIIVSDLITAVNQTPVRSVEEFERQVAASAAAQATSFQIVRNGRTVRVVLQPLPREESGEDTTPTQSQR
ncbi:serine protease, S1-C subfamily [Haloferula helveola]|uniref:Serine protease, S1-C subfamily n=1 Tax=Haloferula helveola TaxID=490095 RepID=A0ABN6H5F6_9BACT|nr:serine protease, S1-C subfamily [Haloferula helveola]